MVGFVPTMNRNIAPTGQNMMIGARIGRTKMNETSVFKNKSTDDNIGICRRIIEIAKEIDRLGYGHLKFVNADTKKKIYISGPVSGTTDYEERFRVKENQLEDSWKVVNPVKMFSQYAKGRIFPAYDDIIKKDLEFLAECNAIYMMDGWKNSNGCNIELERAKELRLAVIYENEDDR